MTITGAIDLECDSEPYTYADGVITIPGVDTDGDCVHDALADNGLTYESSTYDAASDEVTLTVKFGFVGVVMVLDQAAESSTAAAESSTAGVSLSLAEAYSKYYDSLSDDGPSGTYSGSQTVLGETINAVWAVNDDSTMDMAITGAITLECDSEAYTYADGVVSFPGVDTDGDCFHDSLDDNGITYSSTTYDAAADEITMTVKFGILKINFVLDQTTKSQSLAVAYSHYKAVADGEPSGTYTGSQTVLGETIDAVIVVNDDSTVDMTITGAIDLECDSEPYTYADGVITIPGVDTDGDCVHDALADNGLTYESSTYDAASDEVTLTVKFGFVSVVMVLDQASVAI